MSENSTEFSSGSSRKLQLGLSGLHCGGCAGRVKEALMALPGVREVHFSGERDSCDIELESAGTTPEMCVAAVEAVGFGAQQR